MLRSVVLIIICIVIVCDGTKIIQKGDRCGRHEEQKCLKLYPGISKAKIILYQDNVGTGREKRVILSRCCYNLPEDWKNVITQIPTNGYVLRADKEPNCRGDYVIVAPGLCDFPLEKCSMNDLVRSIQLY